MLAADGPTFSVGMGNAACIAIAVEDVKKSSPIRDAESLRTLECVWWNGTEPGGAPEEIGSVPVGEARKKVSGRTRQRRSPEARFGAGR
jgi:hypothetical protein